ncbi:MAG TPA: hypothetical protein VGI64_09080 [Streptosporangiaceae bacterium]
MLAIGGVQEADSAELPRIVLPGPDADAGQAADTSRAADNGQAAETAAPVAGSSWWRRPGTLAGIPGWVVAGLIYLALSVAVWWHVWTGHPTSAMTCACGDPASFVWFLNWPAYAIGHGHSLLFSGQVHVPGGINLLNNTSVLALGVVLAPVTAIFGPIATLNVALTLAPALTAISMYACLRRALGVARPVAFIAGLMLGFSPFMFRNEAVAHLQVTFLALVPVIFLASYELVVTQRGRAWRWGLLLGVSLAVQFFIGLEIFTIVVLTMAFTIGLAALTCFWRPDAVAGRLAFAVRGGLVSAVTGAVLLGYPVWYALTGPQRIKGTDWAYATNNGLLRVFLPLAQPQSSALHLSQIGYLGPGGALGAYIGIPALLLLAAAVIFIRRPLPWLCLAVTVISVWLSLGARKLLLAKGGEPRWLPLPWHELRHLPLLAKITPANFSVPALFFVIIAVALVLDRVWGLRKAPASAHPAGHAAGSRGDLIGGVPRRLAAGAATAILGVALVLSFLLSWQFPLSTRAVADPPWIRQAAPRLAANSVVLFYPFPSTFQDQALIWQANSGMRFKLAGGRGIVPNAQGRASHGLTLGTPDGTLSALSTSYAPHAFMQLPPLPGPVRLANMRAALVTWGVTDVVMTPGGRAPAYARRWFTTVLGAAPLLEHGAWVWHDVQKLLSAAASTG